MFLNLKERSDKEEIMDDFHMEGPLLESTLDKIASINKWLGGNRITVSGLTELWKHTNKDDAIIIADLGCGNGDMLRVVADLARKEKRKVKLIGIDANKFTIQYARKLSTSYPEISYINGIVPSAAFKELNYDIVLSTLFFHHFTNRELKESLTEITYKASLGVVVNDLHRSQLAIFLFKVVTLFIPNQMVKEDGITSIERGFRKNEIQNFAKELKLTNSQVYWKWAFRYQWIIRTNN